MAEKVLVVTPYMALGRLIRQSLEQSSAYEVEVAETGEEALVLCTQIPFSVAILDADITDQSIVALGQSLETGYPDLRLVIIPPNNNPSSSLLEGLSPHAFLSKPFYLPDLLQTIESLVATGPGEPAAASTAPTAPEEVGSLSTPAAESGSVRPHSNLWYEDPGQTFDHLACLSLGPGVHEAIITCKGELWASLGQLSQESARELATITSQYWKDEEGSDLARFITLKTNSNQYFLYATHLPGSLVLSLVYDPHMPFSRIRTQTSQLVRSLVNSSSDRMEPGLASRPAQVAAPAQKAELEPAAPSGDDTIPAGSELPGFFDDLPTSGRMAADNPAFEWVNENKETPPPAPADRLNQGVDPSTGASIPDRVEQDREQPAAAPDREPSDQQPVLTIQTKTGVELVTTGIPNLVYTAVLIPRLPQQPLDDRIKKQLKRWMPQISLAFGWYLENLSIAPEYLEWIVRLSPEVAPAKMVENVRQHTSQRLFAAFAGLSQDNPSGDFWSPDFILACGTGELPSDVVFEFIARVRKNQTIAEF